jgi:hypothetical protein
LNSVSYGEEVGQPASSAKGVELGFGAIRRKFWSEL